MEWNRRTAHLVELIYDSLDDGQGWTPLLEAMSEAFAATGAHLFLHHHTLGEFVEDFLYAPTTPLRELMRQGDARRRLTRHLPLDSQMTARFGLLRSASRGPFEPGHAQRLDAVLDHLMRALRLQRRMRRLKREADYAVAALDRLPTPALIASEELEIICTNRQAEALLEENDALRVSLDRLVAERAAEASALRQAVADAIRQGDGPVEAAAPAPRVVSVSRGAKLPLEVLVARLRPRYRLRRSLGPQARALLLVYDPQTPSSVDPVLLERLFELTTAEAFVAARLAEGHSISAVAKMRRCSRSTVRTHVKRIFRKTHTNRQGELVQLILTSPAISFGE